MALPAAAAAAPACPISYGSTDDAKPNKLYTYFPAAADATFPEFGAAGYLTSPLQPFDISLLPSYTGTADQLRDAVSDVVVDDYCEFNVQVRQTTTSPPATFARRDIVGISTDDNTTLRWGRSDLVDIGDADDVNYGRVWGGRYQATSGSPGGALEGPKSTLQRWANAIGGTAAHEAGHGYGLQHDTTVLAGEDAFTRHLMPAGSNVNDEQRAEYRRHFSDTDFSILASNVGLSIQTMHNWDLVNPNSTPGRRFRLTFLSTQPSMLMTWSYGGSRTPWINPTVSGSLGTQVFNGTTYNRFRITWQTADPWSGGPAGEVPAGGEFHVGATFSGVDFNQPDPIIITNSELLDASGDPLPLKPRLPGYDSGTIDLDDGAFAMAFTNFAGRPMRIRNVVVRELPRVMSIGSMVPGARMRDPFGEPFRPWKNGRRFVLHKSRPLTRKRKTVKVELAQLGQLRHILKAVGRDCNVGDSPAGLDDAPSCTPGFNASLFPATTVFVTAEAVAPDARMWNRRLKRFVRRDLVSRVYYQFGGRRIDLNKNGTDDAIDIGFFKAPDRNGDGVLDAVQR